MLPGQSDTVNKCISYSTVRSYGFILARIGSGSVCNLIQQSRFKRPHISIDLIWTSKLVTATPGPSSVSSARLSFVTGIPLSFILSTVLSHCNASLSYHLIMSSLLEPELLSKSIQDSTFSQISLREGINVFDNTFLFAFLQIVSLMLIVHQLLKDDFANVSVDSSQIVCVCNQRLLHLFSQDLFFHTCPCIGKGGHCMI